MCNANWRAATRCTLDATATCSCTIAERTKKTTAPFAEMPRSKCAANLTKNYKHLYIKEKINRPISPFIFLPFTPFNISNADFYIIYKFYILLAFVDNKI
jgi:hypothetical protein